MNKVILIGRITKDLELRQTTSGTEVLRFSVAVDRYSKDKENDTDFISCIAFGKSASFIGNYFSKGRMIAIEGNIKTGSYEKNGQKVYTTDVIVDKAHFCGDRQANGNAPQSDSNGQGYNGTSQVATTPNRGNSVDVVIDDLSDFEDAGVLSDDSDVPF